MVASGHEYKSFKGHFAMLDSFKRLVDVDPEVRRCDHHAAHHQLKMDEPQYDRFGHAVKIMRLNYKDYDCAKFQ